MAKNILGLACLPVAIGLTLSAASWAQPSPASADPAGMVGQQVRVTTITGAVWPGKLSEVSDDRLVIQGAGGAFTISRAAVRSIEPLYNAPRPRPVVALEVPAPQPEGGEVRIHGSNTIGAQMAPNLIEAFGQSTSRGNVSVVPGRVEEERKIVLAGADPNRAVNVDLESHGSGTAFTSLATKVADLGMASRPVNDKEREAVMAAGLGDLRSVGQEHVIGLDGLSVIVNGENPLSSLTVAQIAAIFTGGIIDWAELGGRPGRIQVYARDVKSGTFDTFNELVLHRRPLAQGTRSFESSTELSDDVAADPNGIGFIGLAYVRAARAVSVVQGCGLAVPTDPFTVRTEEYPLARRLFLYSPAEPTRLAANFLAFAGSAAAQPVVAASGFVNLSPELSAVAYNEFRKRTASEMYAALPAGPETAESRGIVQGLRTLFSEARRLSITFRFQSDSSALDTRGEADMARLVAWTREPANAGRQLVLVGYSSPVGGFRQNVVLSQGRANVLAQRLLAEGVKNVSSLGAGPVSAVACNLDARGQALNRRVEVWAK